MRDPYSLSPDAVADPPRSLTGKLRRIGPGLIMAGAVVGSGELVATTVLGAEQGYAVLWLILVSCAVKVVVQHEMGRYAIAAGETTLEAFNRTPGPRLGVSWTIWLWGVMLCAVLFAIGGMLGAVAQILNIIMPAVSTTAWIWMVGAATVALLYSGRYAWVEKPSLVLVGLFTFVTVAAAAVLLDQPEYFSWDAVADGLKFSMPIGGAAAAVAVFGGTGVGAGELMMYPYWCIEKGYSRFSGPPDGSAAWVNRVRGWLGVMRLDIACSLVLYTISTIAFYLLGAGVLASRRTVPKGMEMVEQLSLIFTETLGAWSAPLFLAGAAAVFYSTIFAVTAAHGRLLADVLILLRGADRRDYELRLRYVRAAVAAAVVVPILIFFVVGEPVIMVLISGIAQTLMLPVIAGATLWLTARRVPEPIAASTAMRAALWATALLFGLVAAYSIPRLLMS